MAEVWVYTSLATPHHTNQKAPILSTPAWQTILHLTDLHFGYEGDNPAAKAARTVCLNALLAEIGKLPAQWKPTIICISGDLVWRAAASDYKEAKAWLDKLLGYCGLGYDKMVLCVGNHEVNRKLALKNPRPGNVAEADAALEPPLAAHYIAPFSTFTDFCQQNGIPALDFGPEKSHLVGIRSVNGIRFVVLNSAWCSKDDKDKDKLWLGQPHLVYMEAHQQLAVLDNTSTAPFTVALMHHPFDWLHPDDHNASQGRPNTKDYLAARCHMLLTGHTHGEVREPDQVASGCRHFTGGASYAGGNYENSFRLIRVKPGQLVYRSFEYDPRSAKNNWHAHKEASLKCATGIVPDALAAAAAGAKVAGTPHCQALATMLADPALWAALKSANLIDNLEKQVAVIRGERTFVLPGAEALYALCAHGDIDPIRLLRHMTAVVVGPEGGLPLQGFATPVRKALIAMCIVLAERVFKQGTAAANTGSSHEVAVPIQSEAIATLIAALHIYGAEGVQLEIGLTVQDGAPRALGALNMTDTPLEPGYPAADSAADLVKMQVWHKLYAQSQVKPGRAWKNLPMDEFVDTQMAALKSRIRQTLGGDLVCDLVLTLDANMLNHHPAHLMADPAARREVKDMFGMWTVLYGADGANHSALAATAELAKTIENAINSVFNYL